MLQNHIDSSIVQVTMRQSTLQNRIKVNIGNAIDTVHDLLSLLSALAHCQLNCFLHQVNIGNATGTVHDLLNLLSALAHFQLNCFLHQQQIVQAPKRHQMLQNHFKVSIASAIDMVFALFHVLSTQAAQLCK